MDLDKKNFFPLFIESNNKRTIVVGGGKIATRRILTLLKFRFKIIVIATEFTQELISLSNENKIYIEKRKFKESDLDSAFMVIAATNDNKLNSRIGYLSKKMNILANVCNNKDECSFYFPAIVEDDEFVIGITSEGKDHLGVAKLARKIEEVIRYEN